MSGRLGLAADRALLAALPEPADAVSALRVTIAWRENGAAMMLRNATDWEGQGALGRHDLGKCVSDFCC